jgi:hypothetical protein
MIVMRKLMKGVLMMAMLGVTGVFAQELQQKPVTDAEIKSFAAVFTEIQVINQEAQQTMVDAITEEGMEIQRFTEIHQAMQMPDQQIDLSDDELQKFENANGEIEKIQAQSQQKMEKVIVDEGLTLNRYQEIGAALQNDPELQRKVQEYL